MTQNDPLVPDSGILTVGLESSPAYQDIGVHWSLPLAQFRFYGPPKVASRSICSDSERVGLQHLLQVALGGFIATLSQDNCDVLDYAKFIVDLHEYLALSLPDLRVNPAANNGASTAISECQ